MQKFRDIQGEIREILDFLDLQPDQTVLEIGTGTGEFALAATHCAKVYAVDHIANMLRDGGKLCLRDTIYSIDIQQYESFFEGYISEASRTVSPEFSSRIAAHIKNEYSTFDWIMRGINHC